MKDLFTDSKDGNAVVNVNAKAIALRPQRVGEMSSDWIAAATTSGKLLLFGADELPQLGRGKGVQTIKLHKTELFPEKVVGIAVVPEGGTLVVYAGKRYTNLKGDDLSTYAGKRA